MISYRGGIQLAILAGLCTGILQAQSAVGAWTKDFFAHEKTIWTSPFRLNAKRAAWLGISGAVVTGLVLTDVRTSGALPKDGSFERWGVRHSRIGSSYELLAMTAGLYTAGAVGKDTRLRRTGLMAGEAALHSFVVTFGLKAIAMRERPDSGSGRGHYFSGTDHTGGGEHSFPSGHSLSSWAVASTISHEYSDKKWVPWVVYSLAATASFSRVAAQRHYFGDVVAGAGIGYLLGKFVQGQYAKQSNLMPRITPMLQPGSRTAMLTASWQWP